MLICVAKKEVIIIELLNLKNDYVFKRIFGYKGNEYITKEMLETILKRGINNIALDENTILEKDLLNDKVGIIDIHARIDEKTDVDIEMQVVKQEDIEKRIMFYWSKLYIKGIAAGEEYNKLNKVIVVLITDAKIPNLSEIAEFYTKWQIREEKHTSVILTDMLEIYIIELPKVNNDSEVGEMERTDTNTEALRAWMNFLEDPSNVDLSNVDEENAKAIKKAIEILEEISNDEHERYLAELREKYIRDQKAIERAGYNDGYGNGYNTGYDNGYGNGYDNGYDNGVKEIVKAMLDKNIEIEKIIAITRFKQRKN